jgi:hypothetical protein
MDITIHDTGGKKHKLSIEGDRSISDIQTNTRQRWRLPAWIKVIIQRRDGQPFFMEDIADYIVAMQYDPDLDPRPLISVRIDASDRSYLLDDTRVDEEPAALTETLSSKLGSQFPKINNCQSSPDPPWVSGQQVTITSKIPMALVQ